MEELILHPPLVHFAIVLPLVALLFQVSYIINKNYIYSQWAARILLLGAIVIVATWYTGGLEGKEVYPHLLAEGKTLLKEHKALGQYIMIGTLILAFVKIFACKTKNMLLEMVVLLGLLAGTSTIAYQGYLGGDIVYDHGAGVKNYSAGMQCLADNADDEDDEDDEE